MPVAKGKGALGSQQQGAATAPAPAVSLPSPAEALGPLLEPLATMLYDTLRPAVVVMQDMDELCELVDILKHEVGAGCGPGFTSVCDGDRRLQHACSGSAVNRARQAGGRATMSVARALPCCSFAGVMCPTCRNKAHFASRAVGCLLWVPGILSFPCVLQVLGEQLARRGVGGEALKPLLARCLADVQGRLIFRAQVRACGLESNAFGPLLHRGSKPTGDSHDDDDAERWVNGGPLLCREAKSAPW